ncbi:Acetamidase regulatory protein [Madurella mycetomatis]|uniref:Acetamidase regulatory protein n=1 Tax=Madurella mycetomatis TaxID=100816 RepID=A0A175W928_9PEZI|nr:Acetamidase regulatory protein [Madurella mycetomatis]
MEPERRRRRPAVSCMLCRRRKIKCDQNTPCGNCTKSKNSTCVYRDPPSARHQQQQRLPPRIVSDVSPLTPISLTPAPHSRQAATGANTAESQLTGRYIQPTEGRTVSSAPTRHSPTAPSLAQSPLSTTTKGSRVETRTVDIAGKFYFHAEHRSANQPQAVTRSVTHKTRLFGQSHWVNGVALLQDMFDILEPHLRDETTKAFTSQNRAKAIGKVIKSRRSPPWPCPPTPELPTRSLADALVECYLRTSESIYRVLHIPTFRRDYEAVWDPANVPDPAFLVQLKLVLAIGAPTHDSTFSLRPLALRWVYEAQTWLSAPEFKSRLGIPSLQTSLLHLLAREAAGVGEDMVWSFVGSTLRTAMYMGLHRDPEGLGPRTISPLTAEMRRRLWNTILEIALQSSLNSGGPPLIGLDDFDTEPPGNFDDEQFTSPDGHPSPKPPGHFTQSSIAIALRAMLPQRLAIAKYLNDLSSRGAYQDTLKLDTDFRAAYKTLSRSLQTPSSGPQRPSDFELRYLDLLLRRYLLSLHLPFFGPSLHDAAFAFSRKAAVDSALKMWRAAFPAPLSPTHPDDGGQDGDLLARLVVCGSGFFRTVAVQAFVAIAVELKTLLREEEGCLGSAELRPDLLVAMEDVKEWAWKALLAGETNTKGYLVACMVGAQVEGLRRGLGEGEAARLLIREVEEAGERSVTLLERILSSQVGEAGVPGELLPELGVEDWDYMVSDGLFDASGSEPLGWMFP